jgi:hypothetical protein
VRGTGSALSPIWACHIKTRWSDYSLCPEDSVAISRSARDTIGPVRTADISSALPAWSTRNRQRYSLDARGKCTPRTIREDAPVIPRRRIGG